MNLFFDLDGTLTDSCEGILNCVKYALESKGIAENNYDRLKRFIGPPLVNAFIEFYGVDKNTAVELLDKYRERFSGVGMFENKLYDGIENMLFALKNKGHKMLIVTGKPAVYSKQIADYFNIMQYFDAVIGPGLSDTEEGKTSLIRRAMDFADGSALMIGDRKFDIEGAKANNIPSVAVLYGFGSIEELKAAQADFYADSVQSLQNLLMTM